MDIVDKISKALKTDKNKAQQLIKTMKNWHWSLKDLEVTDDEVLDTVVGYFDYTPDNVLDNHIKMFLKNPELYERSFPGILRIVMGEKCERLKNI